MLDRLWLWLNGKKFYFAAAGWVILNILNDGQRITQEQYGFWLNIIYGLGGIGLVHKMEKAFRKPND